MSSKILSSVTKFWNNFSYFILGLIFIIGFILPSMFLSLPIFLYRWAICQVLSPFCRRSLGKAVTLPGAGMATELTREELCDKPRFALVINLVYEGALSFKDVRGRVQDRWITAEDSTGGGLKYPEFQQYVESWMGYLFWERDKLFNLANHVKHYKCDEGWTELECEQYSCSITEDLVNKPFPKKRSPWEIHMISNYKNSGILPSGMKMTKLVFRFNHCMVDGFGMFSVICAGFFDVPFSNLKIAQPSSKKTKSNKSGSFTTYLRKMIHFTSIPMKIIRDVGYLTSLTLVPIRTPWYIPESKRTGQQLCVRSGYLQIKKIKFLKDKFGVSFTAALVSIIAAGIANSFKSKGFSNHIKNLPFGSPLSLKGHPQKLRNHWTATLYGIPIDQTLSPLERLKESEKQFQNGKQSTFPYLFRLAMKFTGSQLPFVSELLSSNRTFSTAMSNFPGPGRKVSGLGKEVVAAAGLSYGVAGLGFMVLSYDDHISISIVAENAAMERKELDELITSIQTEIDKLYELTESD